MTAPVRKPKKILDKSETAIKKDFCNWFVQNQYIIVFLLRKKINY